MKVVRIVNDRLNKITEESIKRVDSSGVMLAVLYFLKEAVRFYE